MYTIIYKIYKLVEDNGYCDDDVIEEITNVDTDDCMMLNFDENFPFKYTLNNNIKKEKVIHQILKYILKYNQIPKPYITNSFEMNKSFTWKIPKLSKYDTYLLFIGYSKIYYKKYITKSIIQLFQKYYKNYTDVKSIIKNLNDDEEYYVCSDPFSLHSCTWDVCLI